MISPPGPQPHSDPVTTAHLTPQPHFNTGDHTDNNVHDTEMTSNLTPPTESPMPFTGDRVETDDNYEALNADAVSVSSYLCCKYVLVVINVVV